MTKKNNTNILKLIKYYSLINYNIIYDNNSINRYKDTRLNKAGDKLLKLKKLAVSINNIKLFGYFIYL